MKPTTEKPCQNPNPPSSRTGGRPWADWTSGSAPQISAVMCSPTVLSSAGEENGDKQQTKLKSMKATTLAVLATALAAMTGPIAAQTGPPEVANVAKKPTEL